MMMVLVVILKQDFDCDGNCIAIVDCLGTYGGTAITDECGVCGGPGEIYECGCFY